VTGASGSGGLAVDFVVATLATWRLAALLTREDGPFEVFARLRARAGGGMVGRALGCLHCTSLWVAAPLTGFVVPWGARSVIIWLALSGGACLLDRATQRGLEVAPLDQPATPEGG
jgi:protein-S-isoprenylcysteine O-methyltransferase Ste14